MIKVCQWVYVYSSYYIVLDYGLHHLKIPNVIVFGHYNCGGVALAMQQAEVFKRIYLY